jgi:hypothetical protein
MPAIENCNSALTFYGQHFKHHFSIHSKAKQRPGISYFAHNLMEYPTWRSIIMTVLRRDPVACQQLKILIQFQAFNV